MFAADSSSGSLLVEDSGSSAAAGCLRPGSPQAESSKKDDGEPSKQPTSIWAVLAVLQSYSVRICAGQVRICKSETGRMRVDLPRALGEK